MKDETHGQSGEQSGADMASVLGLAKTTSAFPQLNRWWIAGAIAVGVVAIIFAVRMLSGPAGPTYRQGDVTKGGLTATVTATGTLQPVNTVDLGPEISGQIEKVNVDFNDRVTAGQVLAVMDTDTLKAKVLQSRASLTAAKARVEDAKATVSEARTKLQRIRDLFTRGNASKEQLDSAEAAYARAQAAVGSADAQVAVAAATLSSDETTLAKAEIKSPINGIVLSRTVEPGQVVAATFQTPVLFKLAEDLTKMQLEVNVDEADIGHVQEQQHGTFTVDAFQDRQFPALITQVRFAPKTVDNVVTYQAVLEVNNADLLLRPGMTATATITTATLADATLVPNAALRFTPPAKAEKRTFIGGPPSDFGAPAVAPVAKAGSTQRIWVLKGKTPQPVEIKVGISDGLFTEVV
ncbi:MAG: efflux RND transporter periplasmic adaptor subunit [Rhodospirillaceae bacterium]|nr:efflux RND transporter periplasmic adaptor subunit [Rhodospirillaceae bacterium]